VHQRSYHCPKPCHWYCKHKRNEHQLIITDAGGKKLMQSILINTAQLTIGHLPKELYYITIINNNDQRGIYSFIKQ
jgi:hypothetical protein